MGERHSREGGAGFGLTAADVLGLSMPTALFGPFSQTRWTNLGGELRNGSHASQKQP